MADVNQILQQEQQEPQQNQQKNDQNPPEIQARRQRKTVSIGLLFNWVVEKIKGK